MIYYLKVLKGVCLDIEKVLDRLCKPNPKYVKDKVQQEANHNRNKATLWIHMLCFAMYLTNYITDNGTKASNVLGCITAPSICIVLLLTSNNYHPQVFKIYYNLLITAFGLIITQHGEGGIIGGWMAVFCYPNVVYMITGSIWHFVTHTLAQLIIMNVYYYNLMEKTVTYMAPEGFLKILTERTYENVFYSIIFTAVVHTLLESAYHQVSVADKKKEEFKRQKNFLLGFSHELRNLINSVMGNVKLASLENITEKAKDLLLNADLCGELLLHLVNNILDTGKVEIGELEITPGPVRIYDAMERIWSVCSELIKRRNLHGRMKLQNNIPQILNLDHYRLTQILLNLVGNAVKFTDSGKIDITVEWIPNKLTVTDKCYEPYPFNYENDQDEGLFEKNQALCVLNHDLFILNFTNKKIQRELLASRYDHSKGVLKITVTDTGIGIKKEDLDKVFQRFTQVSSDASRKKLGTGLGLFITKELCERMNGEVRVFSKEDLGSAFTLCIPIEPVLHERALVVDQDLMKNIVRTKALKAIVVDDQEFSAVVLKTYLNKLGIEAVMIAVNGLEGLEKYSNCAMREEYLNIVAMDIDMPVMNGKVSAQKIREFEIEHKLEPCLLIIVSGNCTESEISECMNKNGKIRANAFLKKPANLDELCKVIASHFAETFDRQEVKFLGH